MNEENKVKTPGDQGSTLSHCSTACPRCKQPIDLDQSGVNGVCWSCGVLWQRSGANSTRRPLLERPPATMSTGEWWSESINDWTIEPKEVGHEVGKRTALAKIICRGGTHDCCDDNARLVAAVPELLDSTQSLLALCERYLGPMLAGGEMTKARAAIAKATNSVV